MDSQTAAFIDSKVQDAVRGSQQELLSNLDSLISSKLQLFQKNISDNQKEISDIQLSQLKHASSETFSFKRRGNAEQHDHNCKVLDKIQEAKFHVDSDSVDSREKASARISEGIQLISHRQKLIKLADSSDLGWKVVDEYDTHQLADNSDDEKRIFRAETRAQRKFKQQQSKRSKRFQPYFHTGSSAQLLGTVPNSSQPVSGKKPGLCFSCGKPGHWKADCFSKSITPTQDASKISISLTMRNVSVGHTSTGGGVACKPGSGPAPVGHPDSSSQVSPVGSLKASIDRWHRAGASDYILQLIREGYRLPFLVLPAPVHLRNNLSSLSNRDFVTVEISSLLDKGCISVSDSIPEVVNPLTVAVGKRGKKRLVLDCRHLNQCLSKFKFRLEDGSVARALFAVGDYVIKFDLKSAYHHLEIAPSCRKYLGFCWNYEGSDTYFIFNVLPFGISSAAHIFTKLTRVVIKYWRDQQLKVLMYLDDGMAGANGYSNALVVRDTIREDLLSFGFLLAEEKCHWVPSAQVTWLGLHWDFVTGRVSVSQDRLVKLAEAVQCLLDSIETTVFVGARRLAGVLGQLLSMHGAVGNEVRLRTRFLYNCLLYRASWDSPVPVSSEAKDELLFWKENANKVNGQDLAGSDLEGSVLFAGSVYTDASSTGYGGYCDGIEGSEVLGTWTEVECNMSSAWRELQAAERVCRSLLPSLQGLTDVIQQRVGQSGMENGAADSLVHHMVSYLMKSRADSTVNKYCTYFTNWQRFIQQLGGVDLPASPIHVALYITHLMDTNCTHSVIAAAKYSIKWMHQVFGFSDPTDNGFVNNLFESSKRIRPAKVSKKDPISIDDVVSLCEKYSASADLAVLRDLAMIVLGFAGFLRFSELGSLRCSDVQFSSDHLILKITKSKTDQYRSGSEVLIAKGHTSACPFTVLQNYMERANLAVGSDDYLFRPLFRSGGICKLIYKNKPLGYSRARECIIGRLREVASHANIGLHSLRAGGATAAANAGVNDRCWKRHGRWRSETAKDGYVEDSLESRLKVTQLLGL